MARIRLNSVHVMPSRYNARYPCAMTHVLDIDDYELEEARAIVTAFGTDCFGFIVTPNVDHVIRHYDEAEFRELYARASFVFLDSRFLAHVFGFITRRRHRVCPG